MAVENDAHALKWAFFPALDDMDVVLKAVANCWLALEHVSSRLKYDRKVLRVAATCCRLCEMCAQQTPACLRKQWSEYVPWIPVPFCFVCSESFVWCGLFHLTSDENTPLTVSGDENTPRERALRPATVRLAGIFRRLGAIFWGCLRCAV